MKKLLLLFGIVISLNCFGQHGSAKTDTTCLQTLTCCGTAITTPGTRTPFITGSSSWVDYDKARKADTSKCVLLITDCEGCVSKSVGGYIISEQWSPSRLLDINKKPFKDSVIIWQWKMREF